jgi:hypothetical protein
VQTEQKGKQKREEKLKKKKQGEKVNLEMKKYKNKIPKIRKETKKQKIKIKIKIKKKGETRRVDADEMSFYFSPKYISGERLPARNTPVACGCVYYYNSLNNSQDRYRCTP